MKAKILRFAQQNWLAISLAILPPIAIWLAFERKHADLDVIVTADVAIVTVEDRLARGVEISYRGTKVSSLHAVDVQFLNAGNEPIRREDFDAPVVLRFSGNLVTAPTLVAKSPTSLPVRLVASDPRSVKFEPLLLNPSDAFTIRVLLKDRPASSRPVSVDARISGIKEIRPELPAKPSRFRDFFLSVAASLLAAISFVAALYVFRRFSRVTFFLPAGIRVELDRLETDRNANARTAALARELQIDKYDYKSNLLLLRLRIETLLREIARLVDIPEREQAGALGRLARALVARRVVHSDIAAAISDLTPTLNKELHREELLLSDDEFELVQRLALDVVAKLAIVRDELTAARPVA